MNLARPLWQRIETLHAVTYFAPESIAAAKRSGLRGFWMGYFGFRAAPLGRASVGAVHASFANFARTMVERSIPDAWNYADPAVLIDARAEAAAVALRKLSPQVDAHSEEVAAALELAVERAEPMGRPLFSANASLRRRNDPVERLWQACTSLREHRGDGHVMALVLEGIDGCEAHRLHVADRQVPHEVLRDNRGFDTHQWEGARNRLEQRGLLDGAALTAAGHSLIDRVEETTDRLAAVPLDRAFSQATQQDLIDRLDAMARPVARSGVLPFPNPMGLPSLDGPA